MTHEAEAFYQALVSRDPRFDGRFFVGVKTTGIYCRSVCPAPKPKRRNCDFYPSAAAAEDHGFRPCKRCRPETAPGSPAWAGTKSSVTRALRLISEGALVEGSVEDLSDRLGLSARHVRRLFEEHLGTSPKGVARTQRLHLAKQFLENSALNMTNVAHAAGYQSLRSFNHDIKRVYGVTPGALRKAADPKTHSDLSVKLAYRPPYDWESMLSFFRTRTIDGVETCDAVSYERTIVLDGEPARIRVCKGGGEFLELAIRSAKLAPVLGLVEQVRTMFDLNADPAAIDDRLCSTTAMKRFVRQQKGLRVPGAWDPFELAVRAVLGQQVTVKAARTLGSRLVASWGRKVDLGEEKLTCLFPDAEALAEANLTTIGLTRARAETLQRLSGAVASGALELTASPEKVRQQLLDIKGIGKWTVGYFAMRAQKDPDAFPSGDVALVNAARACGLAETAKELDHVAEAWRPWRAYAALHLWKTLG